MAKTRYSNEFQYVWGKWPGRWNAKLGRKVKRKKQPAWKAWQKLSPDTQQLIVSCIIQARANEDFPRDLVTWINQEGWEDLDLPDSYEAILPKELTQNIGHPEAFKKEVDTNLSRTINLRKLHAG